MSTLREQLDQTNGRADRAEIRADAAEKRAEGERIRADVLHGQIADLRVELTDAQASAAELQRALDAAQADVEQVTQGRETAEAWAEELRAQLDELQVQFAARDEVIDDAEAIRQAEAERQAKGRWARLRAAWQGGDIQLGVGAARNASSQPHAGQWRPRDRPRDANGTEQTSADG